MSLEFWGLVFFSFFLRSTPKFDFDKLLINFEKGSNTFISISVALAQELHDI